MVLILLLPPVPLSGFLLPFDVLPVLGFAFAALLRFAGSSFPRDGGPSPGNLGVQSVSNASFGVVLIAGLLLL